MFVPDEDNMDVLDDWPLHPTDRVHFTKLTVGACWRGKIDLLVTIKGKCLYIMSFHGGLQNITTGKALFLSD